MKILYLCTRPEAQNNGGSVVAGRNLCAIRQIVGEESVEVCYLPKPTWKTVGRSLVTLSSYGLDRAYEDEILDVASDYNIIFIEGSLLGGLVKRLKKRNCKTFVFAHNVETLLYRQRLKQSWSLISFLRYYFVLFNERRSFRYADKIIALNSRDDLNIQKMFYRKADLVCPITCPERDLDVKYTGFERSYCLFVGSNFFPNIEGLNWFLKHVAPYIDMDIRIVGACCKNPAFHNRILPDNVYLEGYVDNIARYYINADAVIAPIFSGSGMKTKTIEAMSYGKTIFGTNEAFAGIECDYDKIGGLSNTAEEFIRCLASSISRHPNSYTLQLFRTSYTDAVFTSRLKQLIFYAEK